MPRELLHSQIIYPDEPTVRTPRGPSPIVFQARQSNNEFLPHPTISQDRTKSKYRDEAQLFVLQRQKPTGQTLRSDRNRTAVGGLASAADDGFAFLDNEVTPLTEDALGQAVQNDDLGEAPLYGERETYPTIVDETEWDKNGQRLDAVNVPSLDEVDVSSRASTESSVQRASHAVPPWARRDENLKFRDTILRPQRSSRYASDRRDRPIVLRSSPPPSPSPSPPPSRPRIITTRRAPSRREPPRYAAVRKESSEEEYTYDESAKHRQHVTEGMIAGVGAAELLRHRRSREDRSTSSPIIQLDEPAARIRRSFIENELGPRVPAGYSEPHGSFGREGDEHDGPSRSSNKNGSHVKKPSSVSENDLETQIHELKAQLRSLESLRPAPPWQWQVIHRVKHRRGSRPTRRGVRGRHGDAHVQDDDHYRRRGSLDSSDESSEIAVYVRTGSRERDDEALDQYLDAPRLRPRKSGRSRIEGTMPVSNVESYIDRRPELAFIVFRDYDIFPDISHAEYHASTGVDRENMHDKSYATPYAESLSVISAHLLRALEVFLETVSSKFYRYPPFGSDEELQAPYLFVYQHRDELEKFANSISGPMRETWVLLMKYIRDSFAPEYQDADRAFSRAMVNHRYIKYLFKPGDILFSSEKGNQQAFQALSWTEPPMAPSIPSALRAIAQDPQETAKYAAPDASTSVQALALEWRIEVSCWAFETTFREDRRRLKIVLNTTAGNEVPITDLNVYPLRSTGPDVERQLRQRGETYWKCRSRRYVGYSDQGFLRSSNMNARYMIDHKTYLLLHDHREKDTAPEFGDLSPHVWNSDVPPEDPFVLLLPSTIKGYNLHDKKWVDLDVAKISDISWNTKAFDSLVTDQETKDLIEALVRNQLDAEKATDLIDGKGNGLIILLHGGPGTGKTFTAESVAEIAKKPLYRVTCGDIGTEPVDVEKYLDSVLRLGKIWSCVVLLDEADIFLEERTLSDLQRNALVSVFLRVLEYYSGILILTSNRVGTFDEAFKSRIQLALRYENLNRDQRRQIWDNFMNHIQTFDERHTIDFDDIHSHLDDLAKYEMNGRQIRNAITTGRQLAEFRNTSLNFEMLQNVIRVAGRFDRYLEEVKQAKELHNAKFDDQAAREAGTR